MEKRIEQAADLDEDSSRGGDLLKLLKPISQGPSKKNLLTTQAYKFKNVSESGGACNFELSPSLHRSLPEGIQLAIAEAECDATMGLFVEIQRVWVIVDNLLFLWDYQQPGNAYETYSSKTNEQLLVSVALCLPKPDFTSPYNAQNSTAAPINTKPDFLLVLTTFIDITILRLDRIAPSGWLIQETGISSSTDGAMVRQVVGTNEGRIFLAGDDGALHELVYETKRNFMHMLGLKRQCFTLERRASNSSFAMAWLVPPILQKVMASTGLLAEVDPLVSLYVDNSRKLLYALSKRNTLFMFVLHNGSGGKEEPTVSFVSSFDFSKLDRGIDFKSVNLIGVKDLDLKSFEVGSVNVVPGASSIHLIVVGKNGIRVYFTTCESISALLTSKQRQVAGKRLNPVSIRAPPDERRIAQELSAPRNATGIVPANVPPTNTTLYSYCNTQMCLLAGAEQCTLISTSLESTSPEFWQLDDGLREQVELMPTSELGARVYAVEEITPKRASSGGCANELVTQYHESKPALLVLTNRGVRMLEKNRPVDVLQLSLERISKSTQAERFAKDFFTAYGLDEASCMTLYLAAMHQQQQQSHNPFFVENDWTHSLLSSKAGHFLSCLGFLLPGGAGKLPELKSKLEQDREAKLASQAAMHIHRSTTSATADEFQQQAIAVPQVSTDRATLLVPSTSTTVAIANNAALLGAAMQVMEEDTYFSGCFQGLVLLTARLLRPIWQQQIVGKDDFKFTHQQLERNVLVPVQRLKLFMETRHPFQQAVTSKQAQTVKQWTPFLVEEFRTKQIHSLLTRVCEAVQLVIEIQSRVSVSASVKAKLAAAVQPQLTTWREFVTDPALGADIAKTLINTAVSLVQKEHEQEDLLQRLGKVSPTYFSSAHYSFLQAMQEFSKLEDNVMISNDTRQAKLTKAVDLVKIGLEDKHSKLVLERLAVACEKLRGGDNVTKCVDLCASVAKKFSAKEEDKENRCEAYKLCFEAIRNTSSAPTAQKRAWDQVFQNADVQFRYYFFQRWIEQGEIALLFDLVTTLGSGDSAAMEAFLSNPQLNTYKHEEHADIHLQLLAKWFVLVGRTQEAAEVYLRLAKIDKFPLYQQNPTLAQRNEYLNNAMVLSNTSGGNSALVRRELQLLKCRMDVFQSLPTDAAEEDRNRLQYCLVNETELLNDFAYKYKLWEECIAIIQAFGRHQQEPLKMLPALYGALTQPHFKPRFDTQALVAVVARLALRFGRDSVVFPLNDLVVSLERTKRVAFGEDDEEEDLLDEDLPAATWLVDPLLENGGVNPETLFVAYVRYLNGWCETEAQFMSALEVAFVIVQAWKERDLADLKIKVMNPLQGDARDLIGVGPTLRALIDKLPESKRDRFNAKLDSLRLNELARATA